MVPFSIIFVGEFCVTIYNSISYNYANQANIQKKETHKNSCVSLFSGE